MKPKPKRLKKQLRRTRRNHVDTQPLYSDGTRLARSADRSGRLLAVTSGILIGSA